MQSDVKVKQRGAERDGERGRGADEKSVAQEKLGQGYYAIIMRMVNRDRS